MSETLSYYSEADRIYSDSEEEISFMQETLK
jgi:hypothetical protein